ncbi:sensor histidine kinase [Chryseobacterium potabilaquae]|uniref:histidine kinase n=1 Tax=Chryseobacterium potabilaquae TaxID=2675057 RepID=A0A6N4X5J2_9FLAO|nr:HAMP domain-containing sensor histidine kinase [Chryseobacterium potabilaquae]CAA7194059.1 Cell-division control histidine kinase PdhS [Chryseobacterium potabilaquae]
MGISQMRLYCLLFLLFFIQAHTQNYSYKWYGNGYGSGNGEELPQNSIIDIIKDKYGFIWFSTKSGLLKYDGKKFLIYKNFDRIYGGNFFGNVDKDSISVPVLHDDRSVIISKRNPMWSKKKDDSSFIKNKYYRLVKNSLLNDNSIDSFFIKIGSGIYYLNNDGDIEFENKDKLKKENINFRYTSKNLRSIFSHNDYLFIAEPERRRTVFFHEGKAYYDNTPTLYNDPKSNIYWHSITNQVFILNGGNIYISKLINNKLVLVHLVKYDNLEREFSTSMFYDEEFGKLYMGTLTKGLNILTLTKFYTSQKKIPYAQESIYAALPYSKNSVITQEGIEYYRDKTRLIFPYKRGMDPRAILYDSSHNLIYEYFSKIRIRSKKSNFIKEDSINYFRRMKAVFKSGKEHMMTVFDTKMAPRFLYFFTDESFSCIRNKILFPSGVNVILSLNDDLLYVGCDDGLYLVSVKKNKIEKKLAANISIKNIIKTKDGNLWVTTHGNGFFFFKNNTLFKLPNDRNNYLAEAHMILEDHKNDFWISSNNGLFKIAKKKLLNYVKDKKTQVNYYRYTTEHGFLNNEFNGSSTPAANILEDGDFVFPSMEGFVFFNPDEIKTYFPKQDHIFIERASIDNKPIAFKNNLSIDGTYKVTDIYIDIPYYYKDIENTYMEAKLEKDNRGEWKVINNDRKYTINKMPPGKYNLLVRFITSENGTFAYKKVGVEILPRFYETFLFRILVIALGLTIIVFLIRIRTYSLNKKLKKTSHNLTITKIKLKNESQYQQQLVESISHDITSPLRFISLLSQQLREIDSPSVQKEYFESIYESAEQLYKFTLGLKSYTQLYKEKIDIKSEEYVLYPLVQEKILIFQNIAKQNGTFIKNSCDQKLKININRDVMGAILHNLIDNAVKHTVKSEIIISTEINDKYVEIKIADKGIGMSQEQMDYYTEVLQGRDEFKDYGLGLHMVVQLVKKTNTQMRFQANVPHGTIVSIILDPQL